MPSSSFIISTKKKIHRKGEKRRRGYHKVTSPAHSVGGGREKFEGGGGAGVRVVWVFFLTARRKGGKKDGWEKGEGGKGEEKNASPRLNWPNHHPDKNREEKGGGRGGNGKRASAIINSSSGRTDEGSERRGEEKDPFFSTRVEGRRFPVGGARRGKMGREGHFFPHRVARGEEEKDDEKRRGKG